MATTDPPDDDQIALPGVKTTPVPPPPDPPEPGFPNPDTGDLVRRGCLLMVGAFVAAWIILMAQCPYSGMGHK